MVLDPFGGSGTTLITAERLGRKARLCEFDPGYCDATIRRWEQATGDTAAPNSDGRSFADVSDDRLVDAG